MAPFEDDANVAHYRRFFAYGQRSPLLEGIWRKAFGNAYPEDLWHYGYVTVQDLSRMLEWLGPRVGGDSSRPGVLLDMGCGRGGPGLWLAERLPVSLVGVDVVQEAVEQAREFSGRFALSHPARFEVGHFFGIPLSDASVDAVVCVDALWAATDKVRALREMGRVMRPGAWLVFSYWDLLALDPVPYFEAAGFRFVAREETEGWKAYQQAVYAGILEHAEALQAEMGPAADMLLYEAQASSAHLDSCIRRLYVLERVG
jgi:ubiquinone/menaquinone biosynthesis C-methylase UbiE